MTRIEAKPADERDALKREIIGEIRGAETRRKAIGCGACALVWLVVILGIAWFIGSNLAKTGIVRVPMFSAPSTASQQPTRSVAPLVGTKPEDIPKIVGLRAKPDPNASRVSFTLREAELTSIVDHALVTGGASLPFPVKSAQVVIEPGFIELFVVSPRDQGTVTVRTRFVPKVDATGRLELEVRQVMIGALELPRAVGELLFGVIRTPINDAIASATGASGSSLYGVGLESGVLTMEFALARP